ncbi:hypothetical protein LguiA_024748 [Lonicera macranthoides]
MEGAAVVVNEGDHDLMDLPPGFRFHPTDEEIITHYLTEKVTNSNFSAKAIGEADLNKCEPWDLPKKAKMGEKEWFFFCQRDRKYPTGMRTNRATESGYWKATGKDKEIYKGKGRLVGMKKTLVFYRGRAPKGEKTNWVMHEFRLEGKFSYYNLPKSAKDEWVVCRVFHKNNTAFKRNSMTDLLRMNSFVDNLFDESPSLPPLMDPPNNNNYSNADAPSSSFSNINSEEEFKNFFINPNNFAFNPTNYQPNPSNQTPNPIFYSQFPYPNTNFPNYQASSSSMGNYLDKERIGSIFQSNNLDQCKVEQFSSNQSMVSLSQDTGLSTDVNAEISSKQDMGASVGPLSDLESMWNF